MTSSHAVRLKPIERLGLQAIPIVDPVRDEVNHGRTDQLECAPENDRRRDAVAVVVAVDGDTLLLVDRAEYPIHRRRHVGEGEGVVQMIERRMEKALRGVGRVDAPDREQPGNRRADAHLAREHFGSLLVAGHPFPQVRTSHQ